MVDAYQFNNKYYIKIEALRDATFMLEVRADNLDFLRLEDGVTEISTLGKSDQAIDNYLYMLAETK